MFEGVDTGVDTGVDGGVDAGGIFFDFLPILRTGDLIKSSTIAVFDSFFRRRNLRKSFNKYTGRPGGTLSPLARNRFRRSARCSTRCISKSLVAFLVI